MHIINIDCFSHLRSIILVSMKRKEKMFWFWVDIIVKTFLIVITLIAMKLVFFK